MTFQSAIDKSSLVEYTLEFIFGSYVYRVKTFNSSNKRKVFVIRTKNESTPLWHHGVLTQKLTAEGFKQGIAHDDHLIFSDDHEAIEYLRNMTLEA